MTYNFTVSGAYLYVNLEEELTTNTIYTLTISDISGVYESGYFPLVQPYSFWFTSQYCPLFTSLTRVQLGVGPTLATWLTDDTIYRLIHKNSIDAVDIYNSWHNTSFEYDYWGCTWETVPVLFRQYVECKTVYDIFALQDLVNSNGGIGGAGQLKTLGDLTIRYDGNSVSGTGDAKDPNKKKQAYDCYMEALNGIKNAGILSAVKGWYDTTKQFPHPTYDIDHNRVIRTVDFSNSTPNGPWARSTAWRPNI